MRIYHPKHVRPDAPQNQELEGLVREVVTHTDREDVRMRFFGTPNVEAIPARITGRRPDKYEQPREMVIVAFNKETPVGYTDIVEDTAGERTAEIAMLVRSDVQRHGIGEAMVKKAVEEARKKGIRYLKGYVHLENYKMKQALKKWSEDLHVRMRKEWEAGALAYVLDLGPALRKEPRSRKLDMCGTVSFFVALNGLVIGTVRLAAQFLTGYTGQLCR